MWQAKTMVSIGANCSDFQPRIILNRQLTDLDQTAVIAVTEGIMIFTFHPFGDSASSAGFGG